MEFSRQEYWNGLPFPSPGNLPNPGAEPGSSTLQADSVTSEPPEKLNEIHMYSQMEQNRESRNKSVNAQSTGLQQGCQVYTTRKDNPSVDGVGKTENPVSK